MKHEFAKVMLVSARCLLPSNAGNPRWTVTMTEDGNTFEATVASDASANYNVDNWRISRLPAFVAYHATRTGNIIVTHIATFQEVDRGVEVMPEGWREKYEVQKGRSVEGEIDYIKYGGK